MFVLSFRGRNRDQDIHHSTREHKQGNSGGGAMNFKRRVRRLEKEMHVSTEIVNWRVTICGVVEEVDRARSTCQRTLSNGQL